MNTTSHLARVHHVLDVAVLPVHVVHELAPEVERIVDVREVELNCEDLVSLAYTHISPVEIYTYPRGILDLLHALDTPLNLLGASR